MPSKFGPIEKNLARALSKTPLVKSVIKQVYSRIIYLTEKKGYSYKTNHHLTWVGPEQGETFFGYYDKVPESEDGYILCHVAGSPTHEPPDPKKPIQVALFSPDDLRKPLFSIEVTSYNWQQGCRLQWLDNDQFIFNIYDERLNRYRAKLVSRYGDVMEIFDAPVQDAYGAHWYISLNYDRLNVLEPDYGYRNRCIRKADLPNLDECGAVYVSMKTRKKHLLYSIADICRTNHRSAFDSAEHCINHLMISPNGEKFLLLHRYFLKNRRFDRLLVASVGEPKTLKLIADNDMVSHYSWLDNDWILAYLRSPEGVDGYYLISTKNLFLRPLCGGTLNAMGDGHPHTSGDFFVTDTYPDRARMQGLLLGNCSRGTFRVLAEFYHGFEFSGECRCDLHPRLIPGTNKIYLDTVCSGKRKLVFLEAEPV